MRSSDQSIAPTPPPWNEADSFRETMLQLLDDSDARDALRCAGQVIFDLAVAVTQENGTTPQDASVTRAELRAVAADLRYTGGYLLNVVAQSAVDCDLDPADDELARFAGKIGARVTALVEKIDRRLS